MSPFEFFSTLDVNNSARISKIEFKTGMQSLGISMSTSEFNDLWKMIKKPVKKMTQQQLVMEGTEEAKSAKASVAFEDLTYFELLEGFNLAGCFKYAQSMDTTNNLINKFRQQLKKRQYTVEKAYRQYDPDDNKFVFKHDFSHECVMMGLEFSEEELGKIFEYICQVGTKGTESKDQQAQQLEKKTVKSSTRFTYKQLHDAVLVQRDENWLFNAYIKIHGMVL
jgi:Ca2+-binding EF-hand superfamily protein